MLMVVIGCIFEKRLNTFLQCPRSDTFGRDKLRTRHTLRFWSHLSRLPTIIYVQIVARRSSGHGPGHGLYKRSLFNRVLYFVTHLLNHIVYPPNTPPPPHMYSNLHVHVHIILLRYTFIFHHISRHLSLYS